MSEKTEKTVEEKPAAPPAAPVPSRPRFPLLARAWVVLMGACWALTVAQLLEGIPALAGDHIPVGRVRYGAGAFLLGLAAGGAMVFLTLKRFGSRLEYAKPGQGKWARVVAFTGIGSMAAFGCYAFYQGSTSSTSVWWTPPLWSEDLFGKAFTLRPILFPSLGIFTAVMLAAFLFVNREKSADFLIEAEGEVKRVSWPARKEYVGASVVVVVVVVVVSLFLHVVDLGLSRLMKALNIGF